MTGRMSLRPGGNFMDSDSSRAGCPQPAALGGRRQRRHWRLARALLTAAFTYVALKLATPGSTVAAILGFAVLRGALGKGSIVENNINQTVASGINNASPGVAFTLPALFLLGEDFDALSVILAAIAGSFLGIVVIIPLRKQMIELERLRFPSGIAVASLLKSPGAGARQAKLLGSGFAVAALVHWVRG